MEPTTSESALNPPAASTESRPKVVVAGATGFIGTELCRRLSDDFRVVGLTRRREVSVAGQDACNPHLSWQQADLFSLRDAEHALAGATVAVYLVHSMLPSAKLSQGGFEDMDLLLADNFARAAASGGVRRVVYLGGLIPEDESELSAHLESRREVEETLGRYGAQVTALRAGLVVGPAGSSSRILTRLVGRLPVMICPSWTLSASQPVDVRDAVELLAYAVRDEKAWGVADIGGPDVMSYREMIQVTAKTMNKKRFTVVVPFFSPRLSRLWVSLVTQTPKALVAPLIESLRHSMVAKKTAFQQAMGVVGRTLAEAIQYAIAPRKKEAKERVPAAPAPEARGRMETLVRSVQRLPLPGGWDAVRIASEYMRWLPSFFRGFLVVEVSEDGYCTFRVPLSSRPLLELEFVTDRSHEERSLFWVRGGLLADVRSSPRARLEFRVVLGGRSVLGAIHDFKPKLPWFVYVTTQAVVHLWVMKSFGRFLARQSTAPAEVEQTP